MIKAFPEDKSIHMSVAISDALRDYLASRNYDTWERGNVSICANGLRNVLSNRPEFLDDYNALIVLFDEYNVDYLDVYRACDTDEDFTGWENL